LSKTVLAEVLNTVLYIQDEPLRVVALSNLAPYLSESLFEEALKNIRNIHGKRPRNLRKNEEISILGFAKLRR
jgi:chromosome segregation and condensation protein ScpB